MVKKLIITAIIALVVILSVILIRGQLQIDHCLDSGGRWSYEHKMCENEATNKKE